MRYFVLIFSLFLFFNTAYAGGLSISEIMYDLPGSDSAREWIEVYNNTGSSIDLTKYKLFESGTSHSIVHYEGNLELTNGEYAVIADNAVSFLNDNPNFPKTNLYDSSFSLANDKGETLALKDSSGNIVYEIVYDISLGANGDGKTLQQNSSGSWFAGDISFANSQPNNQNNIVNNQNITNPEVVNTTKNLGFVPYKKDPLMRFDFTSPESAILGQNVKFKLQLFGLSGENITQGVFIWNFGDGETVTVNTPQEVDHVYMFPGNYTVSVSYKYASWHPNPISIGKTNILVIDSPLVISNLFLEPFPAVSIKNNKDAEYDIGKYIIQTNINNVIIPEGTYIGAKDDIVIRLPIGSYNKDSIKILSPSGFVISEFKSSKIANSNPVNRINTNKTLSSNSLDSFSYQDSSLINPNLINLDDNENPNSNSSKYTYIWFLGLLFISGSIVFVLRFKYIKSVKDDDDYILQDE